MHPPLILIARLIDGLLINQSKGPCAKLRNLLFYF